MDPHRYIAVPTQPVNWGIHNDANSIVSPNPKSADKIFFYIIVRDNYVKCWVFPRQTVGALHLIQIASAEEIMKKKRFYGKTSQFFRKDENYCDSRLAIWMAYSQLIIFICYQLASAEPDLTVIEHNYYYWFTFTLMNI